MVIERNLTQIRQYISEQVGKEVRLESNKRHNKSIVNEGIIASVYPSIFTIELNRGKETGLKTASYSYTDLLTNSVELTVH
ncbi:MAG: Veg family protein [Defluviitaleaceae bacterium]|nr:Veg family protein [Defluviitaleaceae bacterium]